MQAAPEAVSTFTMGYSDGEDRIWVRLVLTPPREARLWLTRQMTLNLAKGLAGLIVKHREPPAASQSVIPELAGAMSKAHLSADFQAAKANPSDREAPPPPDPKVAVFAPGGLCPSVDLTPPKEKGAPWQFIWRVPGSSGYLLSLPEASVLKLTAGLLNQANLAGWNFPPEIEKQLAG